MLFLVDTQLSRSRPPSSSSSSQASSHHRYSVSTSTTRNRWDPMRSTLICCLLLFLVGRAVALPPVINVGEYIGPSQRGYVYAHVPGSNILEVSWFSDVSSQTVSIGNNTGSPEFTVESYSFLELASWYPRDILEIFSRECVRNERLKHRFSEGSAGLGRGSMMNNNRAR